MIIEKRKPSKFSKAGKWLAVKTIQAYVFTLSA